ncbi:hypothetical protein RND71_030794 [Anisodus tanguticus]|uniref:Uncharacterized protein n=1 Tax=Anisodus tanguticus TaxID=243964 RepID=A0AAE1RGR5_9SOLA|nr:hypothetical protein RND71_030794 [Anisodus tanguticus]
MTLLRSDETRKLEKRTPIELNCMQNPKVYFAAWKLSFCALSSPSHSLSHTHTKMES